MENEWDQQFISEMCQEDNHYIQWYEMNRNISSFVILFSTTLRQLMHWVRAEYPIFSRDICLVVSRKIRYKFSVISVANKI